VNGFTRLVIAVAVGGALFVPSSAAADQSLFCSPGCDIVVNSTVDEPDADPGDGACATAAGDCTLRAAVQEANVKRVANVLVPRGEYVLTRHGLDDDASRGDLDIHFGGQVLGAGQSRTVVDGDDADRVFDVHPGAADLVQGELSHLAVRHGRAVDGPGGGIRAGDWPYTLSHLYVTNNEAVAGGADGAGDGGGIAALVEVHVRFSHIAYNRAVNGAGMWWSGIQGTFRADAFGDDDASNLTLTANTAGGHGGGAYFLPNSYGGFSTRGLTIASNSAPHGMGGGVWVAVGTTEERGLGASGWIVADNGGGGNCGGLALPSSGGGNIEDDDTCGFVSPGDLPSTDPLLDELAYNGGPTPTRAPLEGSPAIDFWQTCGGAGLTDQRGVARPQGPACDAGAFEAGDCCPAYEPPYVPAGEEPPPPPKEGDCGVIRIGTPGGDLLAGDRGHNQMYGRAGNDQIFGRSQSDCLYAGTGNDLVRGGAGTDLLVGFAGDDELSGGDQEDVVRGGRGRDRILGGDDEDRLFGGPGPDYIRGGGGYDVVEAGPGDDTIDATRGGVDRVDCGPGADRVRAKRTDQLEGCERVHYVD
jgi:CSLREA domain-containing protein